MDISNWEVIVHLKGKPVFTKVVRSKRAGSAMTNVVTNIYKGDCDQITARQVEVENIPIKEETKMEGLENLKVVVTKEQAKVLESLKSQGFTANKIIKDIATSKNPIYSSSIGKMDYRDIVVAMEIGFVEEKTPEEQIKVLYDRYYTDATSGDYDRKYTGETGVDVIQSMLSILGMEIEGINKLYT